MKPRFLTAAALAAALSLPAHALDVLEVWQAAVQHDPDYAAARAGRDAGRAQREQSGALWRPTLALEAGASWADHESSMRGAGFSAPGFGASTGVAFDTSVAGPAARAALALRQPLYDRGRDAQQRQLQLSAEVAELQAQQAGQALMLRSAERYFDVALAAEQQRLVQRQLDAVERLRVEAQDRFNLGDRPVLEVHEATARAAALQSQRVAAGTALRLRLSALANLSGLQVQAAALSLPAREPAVPAGDALDLWLARADQGNPGLRVAERQVQAARQEAEKTRGALSPTVDLVAQLGRERHSGHGDYAGSASNAGRQAAVGVQLAVPLYTGGLRGARHAESLALVDKAQAELERARLQVAQEVRDAWLNLEAGRSRIAALQAALAASQARLDATRTGVQAGDRTTLDLLNAENDAAAAELALQQARVALLMHRLRLAALAGEMDEGQLRQADALR